MSYKSRPDYSANSQAEISSQVSDLEDGVTCFATLEQTLWILSQTSSLAIGPSVIATRSGVGRWIQIPTYASPVASNHVDVDFDFGSTPIQNTSVYASASAAWVTSEMSISYRVLSTSTHTAEDAAIEGFAAHVLKVDDGVGFEAVGVVQYGTNGTYRVRFSGA